MKRRSKHHREKPFGFHSSHNMFRRRGARGEGGGGRGEGKGGLVGIDNTTLIIK